MVRVGGALGWVGPEEALSDVGSECGRPAGIDLAIRSLEGDGALPRGGDLPPAFVDHPMMAAAEHDQEFSASPEADPFGLGTDDPGA